MQALTQYFEAEKAVHEHIGFTEQWKVYPLEDSTEMYWHVNRNDVYFAETIDALRYGLSEEGMFDNPEELPEEDYYKNNLIRTEYIYRGSEYTGILVDTQTDGNKFLQIFDNSKEVKIG